MPRVRWDGDASGAVAAQEALNKAAKNYETTAKGSAQSAKQLEAAAKRVVEQAIPQERYNAKMRQLRELVDQGKVSLGQATQVAARYQQQLDAAGASGERAFGARFVNGIGDAIKGFVGVTSAVAVVKDAFTDLEERAQAAADSVSNALGNFGELQQLGPEGFKQGLSISRQLVARGVVSPDNKALAADIASDLINAGFSEKQIQFLVKDLGESRLVKAENLTAIGGNLQKIQRTFGESDLEATTAKVLNAARETQANLAQTSRETLKFAPLAAKVGVNLPESLAAFEIAEQRSASPEAAAENLKSFFSQVFRRNLAKGDLQGTVANIQSQITGGKNAFDILGDANAVIGYQQLSQNLEALTRREAAIGGATFDRTPLLQQDPVLRSSHLKSKAQGALADFYENGNAEAENLLDSLQAELDLKSGFAARYLRKLDFGVADLLNQEAEVFRAEIQRGQLLGSRVSEELLSGMLDYLKRIDGHLEKIPQIEKNQRGKLSTRAE